MELHLTFDRLHRLDGPCRFVLALVGAFSVAYIARDDIIDLQITINKSSLNLFELTLQRLQLLNTSNAGTITPRMIINQV